MGALNISLIKCFPNPIAKWHHTTKKLFRNRYTCIADIIGHILNNNITISGLSKVKTALDIWEDDPENYITLLSSMLKDKKTVKMVSKRWKDDAEFGRQMLNGPHPIRIRRCSALPKNLQITNESMLSLMENGKSLKTEMKVFIIIQKVQKWWKKKSD